MPRFSEEKQKQLIEYARQLYCKGFEVATIADIMGSVSPATISKWARENNFELARKSRIIALAEIRNSILDSYADLLDGKKPKIKPDEAVKYAAAFEKFSAKKQVLTYMHEAFELLTEEFLRTIQNEPEKRKKETILANLKTTRELMDQVLTRMTNEVLGDES